MSFNVAEKLSAVNRPKRRRASRTDNGDAEVLRVIEAKTGIVLKPVVTLGRAKIGVRELFSAVLAVQAAETRRGRREAIRRLTRLGFCVSSKRAVARAS